MIVKAKPPTAALVGMLVELAGVRWDGPDLEPAMARVGTHGGKTWQCTPDGHRLG